MEMRAMWAPNFPQFYDDEPVWHAVNPLMLYKMACQSSGLVNANRVKDEPPEGVYVCKNCRWRLQDLKHYDGE